MIKLANYRGFFRGGTNRFVYMVPNLPGGHAATGSVYKGMPGHLEEEFAKMPELKTLFIPVDALPGFKQELEEQGTKAHRLHQSVQRQTLDAAKVTQGRSCRNSEEVATDV